MARTTVYHLTLARHLPLIEEEGLRTRADLSRRLGPVGPEDRAAPGRYAHGKRVSAFLSLDHARTQTGRLGGGLVRFTVDPGKAIGIRAASRGDDPADYWAAARDLDAWLAEGPPGDLEVHQPVPVRAKYLQVMAPLFGEDELGEFAAMVNALADEDRLSAKAMMHLLVVHAGGDFDGPAFRSACVLAWRDQPDRDDLQAELRQIGADNVASAALAEYGGMASDAALQLRETLDGVRAWGDDNGLPHSDALLTRAGLELQALGERRSRGAPQAQ